MGSLLAKHILSYRICSLSSYEICVLNLKWENFKIVSPINTRKVIASRYDNVEIIVFFFSLSEVYESKITGDCCVLKFLRCSVDGKTLHTFSLNSVSG